MALLNSVNLNQKEKEKENKAQQQTAPSNQSKSTTEQRGGRRLVDLNHGSNNSTLGSYHQNKKSSQSSVTEKQNLSSLPQMTGGMLASEIQKRKTT